MKQTDNALMRFLFSRPRDEYIATILKPASWGGAIELSVLSAHYKTEISSIDVESGRVDRFEPSSGNETGNRQVSLFSLPFVHLE